MARATCSFLAAAHDIGKANRYFQAKAHSEHGRLQALGAKLPPSGLSDDPRHGQATAAHLKPWLSKRWRWNGLVAETVARAVGGHHGTYPGDIRMTPLDLGQPPWKCIGESLLDALADALAVVSPPAPTPLNAFLGWVSGFASVADWLGSHESMTIWQTQETAFSEYLRQARCRAEDLLSKLNWHAPPSTPQLPLADLLPRNSTPKQLQQLAVDVAQDFSLAIVEAPTGEGKTEAAFALSEPTRSRGAGVYFALPTMATANGLYHRVRVYLQKATGNSNVDARLLHSQAWLFRDKAKTAENPGQEGREQETQAQDWFSGAKRGLLCAYGVGTVDQALVAALRARHGFVRLFALAGKTVVIDEVHAYDVYMANLMDVLLGWLRALGCRVILLSATLPSARRTALLESWGFDGQRPDNEYPCITWITAKGQCHSRSFDVQARKPLSFELVQGGESTSWSRGAAHILELVRSKGGLGALILNTVGDVQCAFDWLRAQELNGIHLELFHARFTAQDRDAIEKRVLDCFGKDGSRRHPAILVATQVVEQSLDLDFDHMVSALAPMDLLIQRAGRLHRHRRRADGSLCDGAPDERPNPTIFALAPAVGLEGLPDIGCPVYSHAVLMRTLQRLEQGTQIIQPSDVASAVDAVYPESIRESEISAWARRLEELELKASLKTQRQERQAKRATISDVDDDDHLIVEDFMDLDENDERQGSQLAARTRLEDRPSITVALLCGNEDQPSTIHGGDPESPRDTLLACVRISTPFPLWEALLTLEPLPAWAAKGSLSHARPIVLVNGTTTVGEYEISYDASRGLHWRKTQNGHV